MLGENLAATEVPLSQPLRFGVDLKVSPLVYVPDLVDKILQLLDQNDRYCKENAPQRLPKVFVYRFNRLTWHDGLIPESEVWVNFAGEKGADTVKLVLQICNFPSPNSV